VNCDGATLRLACQMGVYCPEHNFIHGAEAEEMRQRLEALIVEAKRRDSNIGHWELQGLLDEVGARDSVAFLEITKKHERDDKALARERGLVPEKKRKAARK
jgi:hypothetical protein